MAKLLRLLQNGLLITQALCKEHLRKCWTYAQPDLTRFNKIAIQAIAQMHADKKAFGLSRANMYESRCNLPLRGLDTSLSEKIPRVRIPTYTYTWLFLQCSGIKPLPI